MRSSSGGLHARGRAGRERRYAVQLEEVRRQGQTIPKRLTFEGEGPVGGAPSPGLTPRFFADGSGLVYQRVTGFDRPAYMFLDLRTGLRRELLEIHGGGPVAPT